MRGTPPTDSCEIRVWAGFGLQPYPEGGHPLEGLALRRDGDRFSGMRFPRAPGKVEVAPISGWPAFWRSLVASRIFDLPDATELRGYRLGLDGTRNVVEYRHGGGPAEQDLPEAKQFLSLLDLLRRETGFDAEP